MARKFLSNIDLAKNELQNAVIQPLASAPSSPVEGQIYYNTTDDTVYVRANGAWLDLGQAGGGSGVVETVAAGTNIDVDATDPANPIVSVEALVQADIAGLTTADSPQFTAINLGAATDTTITRTGAGAIAVEGTAVLLSGGALGTPASGTLTNATGLPVAGITSSTSTALGVGSLELGHATDTTLSRSSAGVLAVEGVVVPTISSTSTFTNKTIDANGTGNSITNLEVADFAANVADTDATLAANSNIRIATQAAVKSYVDNSVQGLSWKQAVRAASAVAGTLASSFENGDAIDGVTLATGDRILIKDQASGGENGIYVVAASGAPTRATDVNTAAEILGATVFVSEGTTNADTVWNNTTNAPITLGTTATVWGQVSGGTVPAASTTVAGKVELATDAETNTGTDTVRAITPSNLEAWTGSAFVTTTGTLVSGNATAIVDAATTTAAGKAELAIAAEAEARTDAVRAVTPLSLANFPVKKTFTVGDNSATSIALTHSLGTKEVITQVRQASDDAVVECDIVNTSTTVTTLTFAVAPATNAIKAVVMG